MTNLNLLIAEHLEKYLNDNPIDENIKDYERAGYSLGYGCSCPFKLKDYILAFFHQYTTGDNVIKDYFNTLWTLLSILDFRDSCLSYSRYNHYLQCMDPNIDYDEYLNKCISILNYNGTWDIDELMQRVHLTKEILDSDINEINNEFPTFKAMVYEKANKARDNYAEKYYKCKRTLSPDQMNTIFNDKICKLLLKNNQISSSNVVIKNVKYPVLLILFKDNKPVNITKVATKLAEKLVSYLPKYDIDTYSFSYFSEDIINDIYSEFIVSHNPEYLSTYIGLDNSIYRSLNHIKQRYKGVKDIDMRVIKNVIRIYEIPQEGNRS